MLREIAVENAKLLKTIAMKIEGNARPKTRISMMEKYNNLGFPLKSINDFQMLEEVLQNRHEFEDAVNEFATYGGADIYKRVKRMMTSLISQ